MKETTRLSLLLILLLAGIGLAVFSIFVPKRCGVEFVSECPNKQDLRIGNAEPTWRLYNPDWTGFAVGERRWVKYDVPTDVYEHPTKHGGECIGFYQYSNEDSSSRYFGEYAQLTLYDLSERIEPDGKLSNSLVDRRMYRAIADDYCATDSDLTTMSDRFSPEIALESPVYMTFMRDGEMQYRKEILVLAGARAYQFFFALPVRESGPRPTFDDVDEHFAGIVQAMDFASYRKWKEATLQNETAKAKAKCVHTDLFCALAALVVLALTLAFVRPKRQNRPAFRLAIYAYVLALLALLGDGVCFYLDFTCSAYYWNQHVQPYMWLTLFAATVYVVIISLLRRLSANALQPCSLVPPLLRRLPCREQPVRLRAVQLLYCIPLFLIAPLPMAGWFAFAVYVLPATAVLLICVAVAWVSGEPKPKAPAFNPPASAFISPAGMTPPPVPDVNPPALDVNSPVSDVNSPVSDVNSPVSDVNSPAPNAPDIKRFCPYCGHPVDPAAAFCTHCGHRLV